MVTHHRRFRIWIHDRFGHAATHVDGEGYHTSNGVNISVRVGDNPVTETHGTEYELPTLIQAAATQVYAQTQPYRYGFWLSSQGQIDEANAIFRQLYIKQIGLEQRVLADDPHFLLSALNIAGAESRLGHEESALSKLVAVIADKKSRRSPRRFAKPPRSLLPTTIGVICCTLKAICPGAIAKYGDANQRSPRWADPL